LARATSLVGAHVSVAGGLVRGTLRCVDQVSAEVIQVFVANPRGWAHPPANPDGDEAFRLACLERSLPVFVHAPYLINFASPSAETRHRSQVALEFSLRRGAAVGATGVVVHAGSAVGAPWADAMDQVRAAVRPLLELGGPRLLIEPTAGGKGALAADLDSITAYLDALDDERVGLCIDTCHLHAAGHDLSSASAMRAVFTKLAKRVGAGRIGLLHVNDSRDPPDSRRDRHEAIGQGTIGLDAFAALFSTPALRGVPMVVETQDSGQAADIEALKHLRG
jgi:deoxyribonuclease IV